MHESDKDARADFIGHDHGIAHGANRSGEEQGGGIRNGAGSETAEGTTNGAGKDRMSWREVLAGVRRLQKILSQQKLPPEKQWRLLRKLLLKIDPDKDLRNGSRD